MESAEAKWSRRNFVIAGATLAASVGGAYAAIRALSFDEQADQREREVYDWQFPPMTGAPIRYKVLSTYGTGGDRMALPSGVEPPDWFGDLHPLTQRTAWMLNNGGAWIGGVQFRLMIESLRRSVVIQSASVRFLRKGAVLDGAIVVGHPLGGGDGEISEIPSTGANLDSDRPVLRERKDDELGAPFPATQITLAARDVRAIDIRADATQSDCEWELVLEVFADGEPMRVPIVRDGQPFRVTGKATAYRSGFTETGESEDLSAGRGRMVPADPAGLAK